MLSSSCVGKVDADRQELLFAGLCGLTLNEEVISPGSSGPNLEITEGQAKDFLTKLKALFQPKLNEGDGNFVSGDEEDEITKILCPDYPAAGIINKFQRGLQAFFTVVPDLQSQDAQAILGFMAESKKVYYVVNLENEKEVTVTVRDAPDISAPKDLTAEDESVEEKDALKAEVIKYHAQDLRAEAEQQDQILITRQRQMEKMNTSTVTDAEKDDDPQSLFHHNISPQSSDDQLNVSGTAIKGRPPLRRKKTEALLTKVSST